MPSVSRMIGAPPRDVFAALADGWSYAAWVVGAAHMRDVDDHWPVVGAKLHHRVGPWPVNVDDTTTVTAMAPDRLLEIDAHVWPFGAAKVRLDLEELADGRTRVTMWEALSSPLARRLPEALQAAVIVPRNKESLARLDDLAVRRYGPAREAGGAER